MKKKLLSLLLAATLVFSMFSFTAFAEEKTRTEQWLEKGLNEFCFHVTVCDTDYVITDSYNIYYKANKISFNNVTLFGNLKANVVFDGEKAFLYPSGFPFIHFQFEEDFEADQDENFVMTDILDDLSFIKNYEQKINSTVYYVEEFVYVDPEIDDSAEIYKFCFSGDELKLILTKSEYKITQNEIISNDVDDNVFKLPLFSINLTPIFRMIQNLLFDY